MEEKSHLGKMVTVNLDIGGTVIGIACSRRVARRLRSTMGDFLADPTAVSPLGFLAQSSRRPGGSHVLLDRCGFVLGTATRLEGVVELVLSHLTALVPPRSDVVRLRVRALVTDSSATLCLYPLMFVPTIDSDALQRFGCRVVDRLALDIDPTDLTLVNGLAPWEPAPHPRIEATGMSGQPIRRVVSADPSAPSPAMIAAALGGQSMSEDRETALSTAVAIAASAELLHTSARDSEAFTDFLRHHLG